MPPRELGVSFATAAKSHVSTILPKGRNRNKGTDRAPEQSVAVSLLENLPVDARGYSNSFATGTPSHTNAGEEGFDGLYS